MVLADAQVVTINQLISSPKEWDNRQVQVQGEAVGDVMLRGDAGWVNILDGTALGVFAPKQLLEQIKWFGAYGRHGDQLVVTGIFHNACPEHDGETDFHAEALSIGLPGHPIAQPIAAQKLLLAAVLLPVTAGIMLYSRSSRKSRTDH